MEYGHGPQCCTRHCKIWTVVTFVLMVVWPHCIRWGHLSSDVNLFVFSGVCTTEKLFKKSNHHHYHPYIRIFFLVSNVYLWWNGQKRKDLIQTFHAPPPPPPVFFFFFFFLTCEKMWACDDQFFTYWLVECLVCPKFKVANLLDTIIYVVILCMKALHCSLSITYSYHFLWRWLYFKITARSSSFNWFFLLFD